jgi:serine/threonine protein kinase/tetratricopeptide (TPR) repeat protein
MIFKKCQNCGFENPETAKFCNECGAKLDAAESAPPPEQIPAQEISPAEPEETTVAETPAQVIEPPAAPPAESPEASDSAPSPAKAPDTPSPQRVTPSESIPASSEIAPTPPIPAEMPAEPLLLTPASALVPVETQPAAPETPSIPPPTAPEPVPPAAETPPEDYAVEEPKPDQPFGERFKILEKLGTGNLGTVYKVFDKAMERELALKSIKSEIAENKEVFEGFSREMKVERSIVHKNIGRIFELNAMRETPFITMEYVPGRELKSVIKGKKRLTVPEAFNIARQLFNGLSEAHRQGAFHLDLRPDNIIIDKEGTAKIMDLGIARLFRSKGITRVVAGMPQYMSPEQVEGQEADAQSDIYAAGAIVYEMLTGSLPPVGQSPQNPKELNPSIPTPLSLLVLKCLEQDKETRYKTAKGVWTELEQMETIISQVPDEAPSPPPTEKAAVPRIEEPVQAAAPPVSGVSPRPERLTREKRARIGFPIPRKTLLPALVALGAVVIVIFFWQVVFKSSEGPSPVSTQSNRISLAVLPFEDTDPARRSQYLGDAMAETLTGALKNVERLRLIDKESAFSFKGLDRDGRMIGKRLLVDHYLDGNLQADGNKLRIDVRLVQVDSGTVLWSGQYERGQEDLLAVADEIAQAVVQAMGVAWPPEKGSPLSPEKRPSFEVYDAYAQGRSLAFNGGKENLEKALLSFEKAAAKEPGFGLAFEAQAEAYIRLAEGRYWPPDKAFPKAKDAALKALLINPQLAEAQVSLAKVKTVFEWDFAAAEQACREALRVDPDCAPAHQSYAMLLSALGRHREAIDEIRAAQTANPQSSEITSQVGLTLYFARLYDQANTELNKAVATDPLYPGHYYYSALLLIQMGDYDEAIKLLRRAAELGANPMEVELLLAHIYARQGDRMEVGRILTAALKEAKGGYVSQVSIGSVYVGLSEKDQVMACLDNAFAERDPGVLFLKVYPMFDFVRSDPRFVRLLQNIGLGN